MMEQLLAHLVGDYLLQSDWMAQNKAKRISAATLHAGTYTLPFLLITQSIPALCIIFWTHAVIDHYRLARFVVFAKNFLAPRSEWPTWSECRETGYHKDRPPWLSVWLFIIADNTMHLCINYGSIRFTGGM